MSLPSSPALFHTPNASVNWKNGMPARKGGFDANIGDDYSTRQTTPITFSGIDLAITAQLNEKPPSSQKKVFVLPKHRVSPINNGNLMAGWGNSASSPALDKIDDNFTFDFRPLFAKGKSPDQKRFQRNEQLKTMPPMPIRPSLGSLGALNGNGNSIFQSQHTAPSFNSQTPPSVHAPKEIVFVTKEKDHHRGELTMAEKYTYDLSKAQLKASSRTSALLAGFAMVALVELQYENDTPRALLIILGVVTTLLVSVHLLALMMSTCILPYMEAAGATKDSPHIRLKFYVELSWLFSTCIGLLLFLVEIGVIFFVKFVNVDYNLAAYITTAMLIPVLIIFVVFSYLIHKSRTTHSLERIKDKELFEEMPRSHSPSVNGLSPPLLNFDRLASTSCDDVQLTWHGFDRRNAITETRSVFEGWQPSRGRGQHLLLPQTFLSSADKNGQSSHKFSQLSQAHRLKNQSSQSLFEKHEEMERHRGPLSLAEEYNYKLSRAQLKSSSNTSALIVGFAMVALVELHYDEHTPHSLLIVLGVVTTLLVSVHLLALMMSTCILPYMEATGATQDSPHLQLSFFIKLSWLFSTCIGLILFLVEIGIICYIKFTNIHFPLAAYITTAMMIPVFIIFVLISYLIHKNRTSHSIERIRFKVAGLTTLLDPEKGLDYGVKDL